MHYWFSQVETPSKTPDLMRLVPLKTPMPDNRLLANETRMPKDVNAEKYPSNGKMKGLAATVCVLMKWGNAPILR